MTYYMGWGSLLSAACFVRWKHWGMHPWRYIPSLHSFALDNLCHALPQAPPQALRKYHPLSHDPHLQLPWQKQVDLPWSRNLSQAIPLPMMEHRKQSLLQDIPGVSAVSWDRLATFELLLGTLASVRDMCEAFGLKLLDKSCSTINLDC